MFGHDLKDVARAAVRAEMVKGLLWLVGAGVVTGITYAAAEPGGSYAIFWGAMAYGGYRFLRALYFMANPEALIKKASN